MLLERESQLSQLADLLRNLDAEGGKVVLVRGEAGIGKTALSSAFVADHASWCHTLVGYCDDLGTPQPFGPLWDVGRSEPSVLASLRSDDRRGVLDASLDLMSRSLRPTILVIEDTQWADEATLDAIKFLGRRIRRTNGVLVLTFRDGELDADHPLRTVIGDLAPQSVVRIQLESLSSAAVAELIADGGLDVDDVIALTDGNPLFVTEIANAGGDAVPASIQESVMARVAKVSAAGRAILELVSIVPGETDEALVTELTSATLDDLLECQRHGLLVSSGGAISFTHELQRRAVEASLSEGQRRQLNADVLAALETTAPPERLIHFAHEANDEEAIVRLAPVAGRTALALESHSEALQYFTMLEPYIDNIPDQDLGPILEDWAESAKYHQHGVAVGLLERAAGIYRASGSTDDLARTLTVISLVKFRELDTKTALDGATEAVELLTPSGPSPALARALSALAYVHWLYHERIPDALEIADEALAMSRAVGDIEALTSSLSIRGMIAFSDGDESAMELLEEGRRHAAESGDRYQEVRMLINMTAMSGDVRAVARAADLGQRARDTARRYDIRTLEADSQAILSEILLWTGDWASAQDAASESIGSWVKTEVLAWRVLGIIQSRRGGSGARTALERMWALAQRSEQLTIIDPSATALAEHMWLSSDIDPSWRDEVMGTFEWSLRIGFPWPSGALSFWLWKLDLLDEIPPSTPDFYRWIMTGEIDQAAQFWEVRGVPYERGLALMHGSDAQRLEAVHIFDDLGAIAASAKVREELTSRNVAVPRGRGRATREHEAGLTARQSEVLDHVATGATNGEIADALFISERTVENHVAAILVKLNATSRSEAVKTAEQMGILAIGGGVPHGQQ